MLAVGLVPVASAEAASAAPRGELVQVIAPGEEGFARGGRVELRFRLAPKAKLRSAELNNVGIRRFLRRGGSARTLRALLDRRRVGALRQGRNFLRLVVRRGKARDYRTVPFTLVRRSPRLVSKFQARYTRRGGLRVRIVTAKPNTRFLAQLNGRNVSGLFDAPGRRHFAQLSAEDGLRQGPNLLQLRVTHFDGEVRYLRYSFVVPRQVTLAEAGPPRRQLAEAALRLDGSGSRSARQADGKRARGGLRYSWKVVSAPRGSNLVLEDAGSARPLLRAARPGSYRLRLATTMAAAKPGDQATTSFDVTTVQLTGQPLVPIETMASEGGRAGVAIGMTRECESAARQAGEPCFYASPGGEDDLQLLVFDRSSLGPPGEEKAVVNKSFSSGELGAFAEYMKEEMITSPASAGRPTEYAVKDLVVVVLRSGQLSASQQEQLAAGLSVLNVDQKGEPAPLAGLSAPFSVVAVPGALEGKAALNFGSTEIVPPDGDKLSAGEISGYLKEASDDAGSASTADTRAFTWPDSIAYDTRAEGGKSLRLGGQTATIVPAGQAAGSDGIALFAFDPVNPAGSLERAAFVTNANGAGSDSGLEWKALAEKLEGVVKQQLGVALVSSGDIGRFVEEPQASSFLVVQRQLELLGANPDILGRAVARNGTYSMVAAGRRPGSNLPGEFPAARSASSVLTEGGEEVAGTDPAQGRLTGSLRRTSYGAVFPATGNPLGTAPGADLAQILYQDPKPWLLTPAAGAETAGCQEVAFAYLAEQIGGIFEGSPPQLWGEASAAACEAEVHVTAGGNVEPDAADSLAGDGCAEAEATATGAIAGNVREASMTLRSKYGDEAELLPSEIAAVARPAGAPFTEADLTCARNQMTDEFDARSQVKNLITKLVEPVQNTQGLGLIEIQQAAAEVEGALLAKIKGELEEASSSTGSFWASFAQGLLSNIASMAAVGTDLGPMATAVEQMSNVGGTLMPLAQGPEGNPVALTDQYLFLAEQLRRESLAAATRIEQALNAQEAGIGVAGEALVADPGKLAAVSAEAKGAWNFSRATLIEAGRASVFRARQLVYQALWPQFYAGVRLSYKGYCGPLSTKGAQSCWNGSEWSEQPLSLTHASQGGCYGVSSSFPQAFTGTPSGLGAGNEYQPRTAPGELGLSPGTYEDYLMVEAASVASGKPKLAEAAVLAPFFAQPSVAEAEKGGNAAGFYPPEFWWQNLDLTQEISCYDSGLNGNFQVGEPGGVYEDVEEANDVWPTPPRSFCAKSMVGGSERATCTYAEGFLGESQLDLTRLVEALGGSTESSGIWIGAYGGGGAHGDGGENGEGGEGGAGGFARTYASSAAKLAERLGGTTLRYYLGEGGLQKESEKTGAGGASTVVASADLSSGELSAAGERERPCIVSERGINSSGGGAVTIPGQSSQGGDCGAGQNIVLVAGGGGGGGHASSEADANGVGKNGGGGGSAIATTETAVAAGAQGSAHEDNRRSHAGFDGQGGAKSKDGGGAPGGSGIGGSGGPAGASGPTLWTNAPPFFGALSSGAGGEDGSGNGGHGGGGGGGFGGGGGGGAGGKSGAIPLGGSGGAGGGSYAYKGDAPTAAAPSFNRPGRSGALIVAIDGVGATATAVNASRACRFKLTGLGATRAAIAYRNLGPASRAAARCSTARSLAAAAAKRPGKRTFRSRAFRCRVAAPIPARRAAARKARRSRWICTYRASGHPGFARVKFTLRGP